MVNLRKYFETEITRKSARDFLRYIGPGILITVGFIDPGNWASNLAAGSQYGYDLLWMVTLSTIMLIILQHNAAHLGIASGLCISEAAVYYLPKWLSGGLLFSAMAAAVSTALAEILGGAIALQLLFRIPIMYGSIFMAIFCAFLLRSNSYRKMEKIIIAFVSLIGLSFIAELYIVPIEWTKAAIGWVYPALPHGSLVVVMSVLGAVVMPHNLFLHSEIIQSRQWNLENEKIIERQLKYEFMDTFFSMIIGWAINSAMILIAASVFFTHNIIVDDLAQAVYILKPLLGSHAAVLFAVALLFSGLSSTTTAGMAGGSIYAGLFKEPYDIKDRHSWHGVVITYAIALVILFFITNPFDGLIYSQMALSMQLPFTIFLQIYLTSSKKIMGKYANNLRQKILLGIIAAIVAVLNIMLLGEMFGIW
ncbi:Nramp family divalent metal transporter [Pectinatus sottacetonis]|uniref:Nramp family divalent metal transporter n=1 Tax=Pectinatus sottacetonis TaxID=1002795 RepID=UPI0018C58376|nr:Nramp family divalent metal transporter [Pectinatus sottacetonis]